MGKCKFILRDKLKFAQGVTLVEVLTTAAISMIPVFAVATLLIGGQRSWQKNYNSSNRQIEIDGQAAATIFGRVGRKSDRANCTIYLIHKPRKELIVGKEVEFRYWGTRRTGGGRRTGGSSMLPTEYARFYLGEDEDEKKLKIDYGPYPYGARRRAARTVVIADNVTGVEFSRTTFNEIGQGSVRMKLTLEDPDDGKRITIMAATLMRN
jgi:hypothetical protein